MFGTYFNVGNMCSKFAEKQNAACTLQDWSTINCVGREALTRHRDSILEPNTHNFCLENPREKSTHLPFAKHAQWCPALYVFPAQAQNTHVHALPSIGQKLVTVNNLWIESIYVVAL